MGTNPSSAELENFIAAEAAKREIPLDVAKATAKTESDFLQFDKNGYTVTNGADWGIMQINQDAHPDLDWYRVKNDWKYNVEKGLDILSGAYQSALRRAMDTGINAKLGAYSGYNAGDSNVDRWGWNTPRTKWGGKTQEEDKNNNGIDDRDERYKANLDSFADGDSIKIPELQNNKMVMINGGRVDGVGQATSFLDYVFGNYVNEQIKGVIFIGSLLVGSGLLIYTLMRDTGATGVVQDVVKTATKIGAAIK